MLSFVPIHHNDFIQGTKYKIEEDSYFYSRTFVGIYNGSFYDDYGYLLWEKITFHCENKIYEERIKDTYFGTMRMIMTSIYVRKCYKLNSFKEKIQHAMEQRAINMILQNIIGDKTFTY
jgi:hypothetical protein